MVRATMSVSGAQLNIEVVCLVHAFLAYVHECVCMRVVILLPFHTLVHARASELLVGLSEDVGT